jgi:transcriptional regulator with XRE-family HTH domain
MLALHFGKMIRDQRLNRRIRQEDLARQAGVSRTTLSQLERGKAMHVQTDVLDRLLDSLELKPAIGLASQERTIARLQQQGKLALQRERHLRLMLTLASDPATAEGKIARARAMLALWRGNRTCSAFYIERWQALLDLPLMNLVQAMQSLGEWEDALLQNSPWSWAWTSTP